MAMAAICGWDPTFLCAVDMTPRRTDIRPEHRTTKVDGASHTETRIPTPYGDLIAISECKTTSRTLKPFLETREDYRRMAWLVRAETDYDEDTAIAQGQRLRAAIGDRGVMGIWFGPPAMGRLQTDTMFYHLADWPDALDELHQANRDLVFKQLGTLHKAGYDYLFYCVNGTEWISPGFYRDRIREDTREIFRRWRGLGGFILWHSCGHMKRFIEDGYYNDLRPEILETCSEPPVGNLPSLKWARDRIHPDVITKGNMALNILLQGTEDDVRREVRRIRSETAGYRHVVGLSDDILKNTPLCNARALADEARR
jgi:hypothetical protein